MARQAKKKPTPDEHEGAIWIDGDPYYLRDLSWRERADVLDYVRSRIGLTIGDRAVEFLDVADDSDLVPAFAWVIRRRRNQTYTLDDALDMQPDDPALQRPGGETRPPAQPAAAVPTGDSADQGTSGTQDSSSTEA